MSLMDPRDGNDIRNVGHGHVRARPDGVKARCGGPAMCAACAIEEIGSRRVRFATSPPLAPRPEGSEPISPERVDALRANYQRTHGEGRQIIAFTGLAGSGKSTAAGHLVAAGWQRVRFAGPLKAMMIALGCTTEEVDGALKETPCDLLCGKTPRQAMQWLGTEFGRDMIGSDLWIRAWNAAVDKVPAGVNIVVDDCRFPNEVDAVRAAGGVLVRIERPGAGTASVHSSEAQVLPADAVLQNTMSTRVLFDQVDVLVRDISWRDTPKLSALA